MINWINILKGIGIISIVYGHSYAPIFIYQSFYYFHIPLFYFISGYLFNKVQPNSIVFFKSKTKTYMGTYYIYSAISTLLIFIFFIKKDINYYQYLQGMIFGQIDYLANSNLWFLPSLYLTVLLAYGILVLLLKNNLTIIKTISILIILLILIHYANDFKNSIFSITTVPCGLFFFIIGYKYKEFDSINISVQKLSILIILVILIYSISYFKLEQVIDIGHNRIRGNIYLMILNALLAILILIQISKKIKRNKFLEYLGKISLYIFILHQLFVPIINILYNILELNEYWIITGSLKIFFSILTYNFIIIPLERKFSK